MIFLKVNSPKTVEDILKKDVKQATKEVAKYREAIKDVQSKIQALTSDRRDMRAQVAELDNKILACANEADRLMSAMTEVMDLIEGYKSM